ncbi:hypothetical protein BCR34DRAFT_593612 [Clohesyomyces aquaticus]|uniref:Uncharacterized protein n=1 Tax=Clohesyomyces aquaticus TaxID=1231657 RepID=A0A1Y1YH96_9PLEO|nr:hypothetical protein BCR34DRAFT_593612 [Clohesyomyces aquaticus]
MARRKEHSRSRLFSMARKSAPSRRCPASSSGDGIDVDGDLDMELDAEDATNQFGEDDEDDDYVPTDATDEFASRRRPRVQASSPSSKQAQHQIGRNKMFPTGTGRRHTQTAGASTPRQRYTKVIASSSSDESPEADSSTRTYYEADETARNNLHEKLDVSKGRPTDEETKEEIFGLQEEVASLYHDMALVRQYLVKAGCWEGAPAYIRCILNQSQDIPRPRKESPQRSVEQALGCEGPLSGGTR